MKFNPRVRNLQDVRRAFQILAEDCPELGLNPSVRTDKDARSNFQVWHKTHPDSNAAPSPIALAEMARALRIIGKELA